MNPPSFQPETSNLPGTAPDSPQVEASALPRTPQTPLQLVAQEISPKPEQVSVPIQGTRHEVNASTPLCYPPSTNHS
jgi:hypothetical protein